MNSTSASTNPGDAHDRAAARQAVVALAGFAALEAIFLSLHRLGDLKLYVVETIALGLGAGVIYLVVVYALEHAAESRLTLWIVLAGALVFRATLLPMTPTLSDDIYRYQWDARVQVAGMSAYVVAPSDPRAVAIRGPYWRRIPGPDIRAIYPPLTELILRTIGRISDNPFAIKLPLVIVETLATGLLAILLRTTGRKMSLLAIYAWNPLVVVESAASGHNDSLAVAAVLAALVLIIRRRPVLSMLALATAILTKVFPLVLAPLWLRLVGWPRKPRGWAAVGVAALLAIACTWPYRSDIPAIFSALQKFSNSFIDNASLFLVLQWLSGSMDWARGVSAGIVAGMSIWAAARGLDPLRATYLLFGTILLVSQNTFSWYFVWIIPLLCFFPNPAWLLLTILQFLSYHVLIDYQAFDRWEFKPWFQLLEYGPSYALLLWQAFRSGHAAIPDKISAV